jgi:hypothetical protein
MIFNDFAQLYSLVPGVHVSNEISNIEPSLPWGEDFVKDICGKEIYDLAEAHYNSDQYNLSDDTDADNIRLNRLVKLIQYCHAHWTIYHHLPFFEAKISDVGIVKQQTESQTTAFKYQVDALKFAIPEAAYKHAAKLIEFLNDNATDFPEWTESPEYAESQSIYFTSYKDFHKVVHIDNSALFYHNIRTFINKIILQDVNPRLPDSFTTTERITNQIKTAIANEAMYMALERFDYFALPPSISRQFQNEFNKNLSTEKGEKYAKERLMNYHKSEAKRAFEALDIELDKLNTVPELQFTVTPIVSTDKFYSIC